MIRALSFHAHYRCRRSGACCTSNWPIPIEADRLARLQAAVASGALRPAVDGDAWMTMPPDAPAGTPARLGMRQGRCAFFGSDGGNACRIHATLGHDALPLACRQFPRIVVTDPRGISITLSHYCPTARSLLETDVPVGIVEQPPAFPDGADYEGLDAAMALPPLLRPDMLMDWPSWWAWEAHSVSVLTTGNDPVPLRLGRLRQAVELLHDWTPSQGPLGPRVDRAFDAAGRASVEPFDPDLREITTRLTEIDAAIPSDLRQLPEPVTALPTDRWVAPQGTDRFLAAHAFANWTAHLGDGLRSWLRSIEAAYVCRRAGFDYRQTDLRLRHLASPNLLARVWSDSVSP